MAPLIFYLLIVWQNLNVNSQEYNLRLRDSVRIPMNQYKLSILRFLALQIESTKLIFRKQVSESNPNPKDLYGFVLFIVRLYTKDLWGFVRICEDSLHSWKQVESFENWLDLWSAIQNKSFEVRIHDQRFKANLDPWSTNQNKSLKVRIRDQRFKTNPWILKTNPRVHNTRNLLSSNTSDWSHFLSVSFSDFELSWKESLPFIS
jgi:hypothetical protein